MHTLTKNVKIVRMKPDGSNYQIATGQATNTSDSIDTLNYDGVVLLLAKGTGTNANVVTSKLQQSSDDGSSDAYADIAGSAKTVTDVGGNMASKMICWDLYKPAERYLKVIAVTGTQNSAIDGLWAILYRGKHRPVTQLLTTGQFAAAPTVLNNVDAGTA